jgi:hypothetical protein
MHSRLGRRAEARGVEIRIRVIHLHRWRWRAEIAFQRLGGRKMGARFPSGMLIIFPDRFLGSKQVKGKGQENRDYGER